MNILCKLLFIFTIFLIGSCNRVKEGLNEEVNYIEKVTEINSDYKAINDLTQMELGSDVFTEGDLSNFHFGKFYYERLSFYIVDSMPLTINGVEYGSAMTLYFIDEILYKKNFTIQPEDTKTLMNDFVAHYNVKNTISSAKDRTAIGELDERRFFTLKVNRNDSEIRLRKTDFGEYAIEERHIYYLNALRNAKQF